LKAFELQLQNQLKIKTQELELKYKAFQQLPTDTPEAIKRDKASELNYLKENMENFQRDAEASMQKKQNDLVSPSLQKIGKTIETVAREGGYAYIVNPRQSNGNEIILFADDKVDISALVLKRLGVDTSKQIVKPTK
jgi:outer membrane protein